MSVLPVCLSVAVLLASAGSARAASLKAELAPERSCLLAGSKTVVCAVLRLDAAEAPDGAEPATVALSLVADRSGSMKAAGKMEMVHIAGFDLVDWLSPSDELGLVAYASHVEVLRPMSCLTEPEGVKRIIRQLYPTSNTDLGGGLRAGLGLFDGSASDSVRRLLLLTDGLANEGETRPEILARWAKEAFLNGTRVSTIGLGRNYNEKLLAEIAHAGGGEFYYVTERGQLKGLFRKELEESRTVAVRDLASVVRVSEGARFLEMVGFPATGGDETAREVKIGDLFAKETRALLLRFELEPPADAAGGLWRPAAVELAWTDPAGFECRRSLPLEFRVTRSETAVVESVDGEVRARVIEGENYRALDDAMDRFRRGDKKGALETIKKAEELIKNDRAAAGDSGLIEQAGQLSQARREIQQKEDARSVAIHNAQIGCYGSRKGGGQLQGRQLLRAGGNGLSHSAANGSLRWLAQNQAPDGSWNPADGGGRAGDRQRATSLALLSFLAAAHTENVGAYRRNVRKAVGWLISRQRADGRIGGRTRLPADPLERFRAVHDHAVSTLALSEATGMGRVRTTAASAQKAVERLALTRPFAGLDGLAPAAGATDDDVAGVAWCVMALSSGKAAGLDVPGSAFQEAVTFLQARELAGPGRSAFFGTEARRLDTMVGVLCRQFLGWDRDDVRPAVEWAVSRTGGVPAWGTGGKAFDWYYAYFGNLVCFQMGGEIWRTWNPALRGILVAARKNGGKQAEGWWDPAGSLHDRGRVLPTALAGLCLHVYYRYLPMYR